MKTKDVKIGFQCDHLTLIAFIAETSSSRRRGLFACNCMGFIRRNIREVLDDKRRVQSCGCQTVWKRKNKRKNANKKPFNEEQGEFLSMAWR